jgi:hypothetical protein
MLTVGGGIEAIGGWGANCTLTGRFIGANETIGPGIVRGGSGRLEVATINGVGELSVLGVIFGDGWEFRLC